ncbi:hypothetical protein [Thermococcus sp. MAR1]|uniref:hypothetical protein n=1 Tax=Thermococcus sp. MAR1 TaxID=1638263 RepID=UPI00143B083B|nr:hypothetical protein [Thermococcus sp. MAR1]NJE09326.1 hypothetical protein [Thermococcus sp. MAR1]
MVVVAKKKGVVTLTPESYILLEEFKKKLKMALGESYSYSDIVATAVKVLGNYIFFLGDEQVIKMMKNAKQFRLKVNRGEIDIEDPRERAKMLFDVLGAENIEKRFDERDNLVREMLKAAVLQKINEGDYITALNFFLSYFGIFTAEDIKEIREKFRSAGVKYESGERYSDEELDSMISEVEKVFKEGNENNTGDQDEI